MAARTEPGASFSSSSSSDTAHGDAIFDAHHTQGTYSHSYLITTPKGSLEARVRQSSGWATAVNTLRQRAGVRSCACEVPDIRSSRQDSEQTEARLLFLGNHTWHICNVLGGVIYHWTTGYCSRGSAQQAKSKAIAPAH